MTWRSIAGLVLVVVAVAGCERLDSEVAAEVALQQMEAPPAYVDSVFPIEEEVRRFRAQLGGASAAGLQGGAASRDELVARFMAALEARDVAALGPLVITPVEFIDLYYPHTRFTSRPYELSPQLVWFQLENYGSKGLSRAVDRFGGRPLGFRGHSCETEETEGPNRISGGCSVEIEDEGGRRRVSLFGQVLERDGVFKFISYGNRL